LQLLLNLSFQSGAFGAPLLEASRNHHRRLDARVHALADEPRNRASWRSHDRQVDGVRNAAYRLVGFLPKDLCMLLVDGIHFSLEALQEILQNGSAHRTFTIAGADNGHSTGTEHRIQSLLPRMS